MALTQGRLVAVRTLPSSSSSSSSSSKCLSGSQSRSEDEDDNEDDNDEMAWSKRHSAEALNSMDSTTPHAAAHPDQAPVLRVLMIDDEDLFREEIAAELRERGHQCETAGDGLSGLERATTFFPDVVLCDLMMPGLRGEQVLKKLRQQLPETRVIMITAYGTLESAVECFRNGACDYLLKPVFFDDLLGKIGRIAREKQLEEETIRLRRIIAQQSGPPRIVGEGSAIQEAIGLVEKFAEVEAPVLIMGDTGTGKELAARSIHERSHRRAGRFVAVNCAAIPESLLESEFFGYVKGAFSGAEQDRDGFLQTASGGTLFLDEFAELPLNLQAKLLRALESGEVTPVGGNDPVRTDLRLIAATNKDLLEEVESGRFRRDLYYRVRVAELSLPPLREMKEDIPVLVQHFVDRLNQEMERKIIGASNGALRALMLYPWPGNVRELRNAVERAMIFRRDGYLEMEDFPAEISSPGVLASPPDKLKAAVKAYEEAHIRSVLDRTGGNRDAAAKLLGIDRSTLYRKLDQSAD